MRFFWTLPDINRKNDKNPYTTNVKWIILMNKNVLNWIKSNLNQSFESPRRRIFGTKTQNFEIIEIDEDKKLVKIKFKKKNTLQPLKFWRFSFASDYIESKKGKWTRLGTGFMSEDQDTIEHQIQQKAKQRPTRNIDIKSAPHVWYTGFVWFSEIWKSCKALYWSGESGYKVTMNNTDAYF